MNNCTGYIPSLNILIWRRSWFTFIYIWREASDKDFPGVTLQPLSILTAGWRVQAWSQGWVTMAVIKETILKGKKTGATWETQDSQEDRQMGIKGKDRILKKKLKVSVGATLSQSNLDSFSTCKTVFIFGSNCKTHKNGQMYLDFQKDMIPRFQYFHIQLSTLAQNINKLPSLHDLLVHQISKMFIWLICHFKFNSHTHLSHEQLEHKLF